MKKRTPFIAIVLLVTLITFYATPPIGAETSKSQAVSPAETQEMPIKSIIVRTIEVYVDGQKAPLNYAAFIDTTAKSVISLNDCGLIFGVQVEFIDTRLLLRKGSQEFSLEKGDYLQLPPTRIQEEVPDTLKLDEFYLPMRFVAEHLGYDIKYNSRIGAVIVRGADYQGPDPQFVPWEPLRFPVNLPLWGTFNDAPVMAQLWPAENIIAGYFTSIAASPPSRNHNISLSCSKLNGVIVKPGDVFSFNQMVGRRTVEAGYKTAIVFSGGRKVPGIGGGVCQTSSTLYNCLLALEIKIVERHPHSLPVSYVPANRDATISWGAADLKFRNNKPYSIKILSQIYDNYVIFAIAAVD